jgi:hypothetical protein
MYIATVWHDLSTEVWNSERHFGYADRGLGILPAAAGVMELARSEDDRRKLALVADKIRGAYPLASPVAEADSVFRTACKIFGEAGIPTEAVQATIAYCETMCGAKPTTVESAAVKFDVAELVG